MGDLPNKEKLLYNFSRCNNWEEKYLYIIELGNKLLPVPDCMCTSDSLIIGCQSQVWITLEINSDGSLNMYGKSDSSIVRGLIAIVFVLYKNMSSYEIISFNVKPFFREINLIKHLTPSRVQGLASIVHGIRLKASMVNSLF